METFIRNNDQISILRKVKSHNENSFAGIVSANDPFGFDVREKGSYKRVKPTYSLEGSDDDVLFYYNGWRREGVGYYPRAQVAKGIELIDAVKVLVPKAWGTGNPASDWLRPFAVKKGSVCTETYLVIGPFNSEDEAANAISYTQTKFFHYMVSMMKITQNSMQKIYQMVPMQDFSKAWTDEELFAKYELTDAEIKSINETIRPADEDDDE